MSTLTFEQRTISLKSFATQDGAAALASGATTPRAGEELERATLTPAAGSRVAEALSDYPDGGLEAWLQVAYCASIVSVAVGGVYTWGVLQEKLSETGLASTSSIAYIGSAQAAMTALLGIPIGRAVGAYGPSRIATIGSILAFIGPLCASFCTNSFIGLFLLQGITFGVGAGMMAMSAFTLPSTYFLKKRNVATGLAYSGTGFGSAAFSLISSVLLEKVGVAWTLRIVAFMYLALTLPAALMLKSRLPRKPFRSGPILDKTMLKDVKFWLLFFGGALALFPLFVPPFFLPLFASSIGESALTGSLLLAGFNLASAVGRIACGIGADRLVGSTNAQILCLAFSSITTFLIWPFSTSMPPLAIFAVVNGFVNGGFFSLMPGVIASLFGSKSLSLTFSMVVWSWTPGYMCGAPLGAYILTKSGGQQGGVPAFRPAIFYSGALSLVAMILIATARFKASRDIKKRI